MTPVAQKRVLPTEDGELDASAQTHAAQHGAASARVTAICTHPCPCPTFLACCKRESCTNNVGGVDIEISDAARLEFWPTPLLDMVKAVDCLE